MITSHAKQTDLEKQGYHHVVCVDESGCGNIAGSMIITAVYVPSHAPIIANVKDSKQIKIVNARATIHDEIMKIDGLEYCMAEANASVVDEINIYQCRLKYMTIA